MDADSVEAVVRKVQHELGFPGAERLFRAVRSRKIGDELSAKDLRALVTRLSAQESSKQVLAAPPPYDGKIAARALDDRWAMDLISFVQRPHKTSSGVYQYVLIAQDIFSRKVWTEPLGDNRALDDRWAMDLISFVQRPHKTSSGVYQYVLIAQDIFSRKVWTEPLGDNRNMVAEFGQFLDTIGRKPRQLVTDKESIFTSHAFQRMLQEEGIDHQVKSSLNDIATLDAAIGQLKDILSKLAQQPGNDTSWYDNLHDATKAFNKNEKEYLGKGATPADVAGDDELRFEPVS